MTEGGGGGLPITAVYWAFTPSHLKSLLIGPCLVPLYSYPENRGKCRTPSSILCPYTISSWCSYGVGTVMIFLIEYDFY